MMGVSNQFPGDADPKIIENLWCRAEILQEYPVQAQLCHTQTVTLNMTLLNLWHLSLLIL